MTDESGCDLLQRIFEYSEQIIACRREQSRTQRLIDVVGECDAATEIDRLRRLYYVNPGGHLLAINRS